MLEKINESFELQTLADEYRLKGDFQTAELLLEKACVLANGDQFPPFVTCEIFRALAFVQHIQCKQRSACENATKAAALIKNFSHEIDPLLQCGVLTTCGDIFAINEGDDETEAFLTEAVAIAEQNMVDPLTWSNATRSLGELYVRLGKFDRAEDLLRQTVALTKENSLSVLTRGIALSCLGNALRLKGKLKEAKHDLQEAVQLSNGSSVAPYTKATARLSLCMVLYDQNQFSRAVDVANDALAIAEDNQLPPAVLCECLIQLGSALTHIGEFENAERHLRHAAELADVPSSRCRALLFLSSVLRHLGKWKQAIQNQRLVVGQVEEGNDPVLKMQAYESLGDLLDAQTKFDEADAWYQKIEELLEVEVLPVHIKLQFLLSRGGSFRERGTYDKSEDMYRRALALAKKQEVPPEYLCRAYAGIGDLFGTSGNYENGESYLLTAVSLAESKDVSDLTAAYAYHRLGDALMVQGRDEKSLSYLLRAEQHMKRSHQPSSLAQIYKSLGNVYWSLARSHSVTELRRTTKQTDFDRYAAKAEDAVRMSVSIAEASNIEPLALCGIYACAGDVLREQRIVGCVPLLRRAAELAVAYDLDARSKCDAFCFLGLALCEQGQQAEAVEWLSRADVIVRTAQIDPLLRCNVHRDFGLLMAEQEKWQEAFTHLSDARDSLTKLLNQNRWPNGIATLLHTFHGTTMLGWRVCEKLWKSDHDDDWLWQGLSFLDAGKCTSIREGLRRHSGCRDRKGEGEWTNDLNSRRAFGSAASSTAAGQTSRMRDSTARDPNNAGAADYEIEFSRTGNNSLSQPFSHAISREEVATLLKCEESVVIVFAFDGDDLVALPIRTDLESKVPKLICRNNGCFRIQEARNKLRVVSDNLEGLRRLTTEALMSGAYHAEQLRTGTIGEWDDVVSSLYETIQLNGLLLLIEPDPTKWKKMHITLIPDGELIGLPLHAAFCRESGLRFYEEVASIRSGLSLRTLVIQEGIEQQQDEIERDDHQLRGVFFGNPDIGGVQLAGVEREAAALEEVTIDGSWMVFGIDENAEANRRNLSQFHDCGNVVWISGHGGPMEDQWTAPDGLPQQSFGPAVLLCDGAVTDSRMISEGYSFSSVRLLHVSCCVLGQLTEESRIKEVEGFGASLTILGCRRIVSAIWPLFDSAAVEFSRHWCEALESTSFCESKEFSNHAFAVAFSRALDEFRKFDGGRFDHEIFWAPYAYFGIG